MKSIKEMRASITIAFLLIPAAASAQGYIEGNIGIGFISTADVQVDGSTAEESGTIGLDYGSGFIFGVEGGIDAGNLRFGVSWDHAKADVDSVSVSGFGSGGSVSVSCSLLENEIDISCSNLNSTVNIFAGNVYLDLGGGNAGIQPYIGVGAGLATLEDSDATFAWSATAGARYPLGNGVYMGGRYRFQRISGRSGDAGFEYDSISIHGISFLLGASF